MVKRKVPVPRYKSPKETSKEKLILSLFLIFSVLTIIVLFGNQPSTNIIQKQTTGMATLTQQLAKNTFNANEKFSGNVKIGMELDDRLPGDMDILFFIKTNATKCPQKYVCYDNRVVNWYKYNTTTDECTLVEPDPEGACCVGSANCPQIVINSGFTKVSATSQLPTSWSPIPSGVTSGSFGVEDIVVDEVNGNTSQALFLDPQPQSTAQQNSYSITLMQPFGTRGAPISDFGTIGQEHEETELSSNFDNNYGKKLSFQMGAQHKALRYKIKYSASLGSGCAFEVILKSAQGHNLHYYYSIYPTLCPMPASTATDKYVAKTISMETLIDEQLNIYSDWGSWPKTDTVSEISLVSRGKVDSSLNANSQRVYFDDVKLVKKTGTPSNDCIKRSTTQAVKKCCESGAGAGTYYGDQLDCESGKECWSSCTPSETMKFASGFIAKSTTPSKKKTLQDSFFVAPDFYLFDYGTAYTACEDTSNSTSNPINCRGWDNTYTLNLSKLTTLKAPATNGSYEFAVRLAYTPKTQNCSYDEEGNPIATCIIREISVPFYVGGAPAPPNCSDDDYGNPVPLSNWSNWTECLGSSQTRTRQIQLTYQGTEYCNATKISTETQTQTCTEARACDETDYDCTEWMPLQCPTSAMQSRTCTIKTYTTCKDTGYRPEESQSCTYIPPVEEKPYMQWIIWGIVILVVAAALILVVWKVIIPSAKGKGKPETEVYPELTSYIHDAQATGASRQDITAKLQEAGWPKDQIDDAFKAVK